MHLPLAKYRRDAYAGINDHTRYDQVSKGRKPQFCLSVCLSVSVSLSLSLNYLNLLIFVILVMKKEFY